MGVELPDPVAWYSARVDDCITAHKKNGREKWQPWDAKHYDVPLYTDAALTEAVEKAVSQYKADARRLDWLQRGGDVAIGIVTDAEHDGDYFVHSDVAETGYGKSLRDAIDAAIRERSAPPVGEGGDK